MTTGSILTHISEPVSGWLREFLREEKFYFFLFFGFVALIIFVVVICTKLAQG